MDKEFDMSTVMVINGTIGAPGQQPVAEPPRMSFEEFIQGVDEDAHVEWVDGKVVAMAPISDSHTHLGGFLISILRHFIESGGLGQLFYEPFLMKTGPELAARSPDIFIVLKENEGRIKKTYLEGPADLVVEI